MTIAVIAIPLAVVAIAALFTGGDKDEGTSNTVQYDTVNGDQVFSDPNQTPETNSRLTMTLRDVENLYKEITSVQFAVIRNTIDAYTKSKLGKSYDQTGYIDKGQVDKNGDDIYFTLLIRPAGLSVPVHVRTTNYGGVSVMFDNSLTPFDVTSIGAVTQNDRTDPLLSKLPYYGEHYRVTFQTTVENGTENAIVLVDLAATPSNKPGGQDSYISDLQQYQAEALVWIQSLGVDPNAYKIYFDPDPAKPFQYRESH